MLKGKYQTELFDYIKKEFKDEDMTFTIMHNADVSYHDWRLDKNV